MPGLPLGGIKSSWEIVACPRQDRDAVTDGGRLHNVF